ncbi:uncharacterized protein LOC116613982 isoform X2 [Nematostella vectensis]|uniref:uncharacterized protein LOC116613982 isoform X2 n=1 Tax=Nematostella vectensis TaxID=45351 RepID=UPI0020775BCB|nr:uncharacterized protein LOC116613982 isoform X2 [Nematostella vectensis]
MPSANKFRHVERRVRPFELFHAAELHLLLGCISSVNDMELNYNTREGPPPKKQEAVEEQLEADEKLEIDEVFAAEEKEKEKVVDKVPVEQEDIDPQYGLTDRGYPVVQETGNRDEESDVVEEVFAAEEKEKEKVVDKVPVEQEDIDPQYGLTDRGHPVVQETGNRDEESDVVGEVAPSHDEHQTTEGRDLPEEIDVAQEHIDPQYGLTDRGYPVVQETGNRDEESDVVEEVFMKTDPLDACNLF